MRRLTLPGLKSQRGVVIVVALFFVALVATMAYLMMARLERDTRRTSLLLRNAQAELLAQGSIDWAKEQLRDNLVRQKPNKPVDVMPARSPVNQVNGYAISSVIYDMQSRFNLNNLASPDAQADFKRLIQIVAPEVTEQQAQAIVLGVVDWITPGQQQNEFEKYYLSVSPPYRAAHRAMESASELQLVKGMSPALYARLKPFITALPNTTQINIQTAPPQVMAAMSPKMTLETGKAVDKIRAETVIPNVQAFLSLDLVKNHDMPAEKITTLSEYFLVETEVAIEKQHVVLYTLMNRSGNDGKSPVKIIWQSKSVPG
ncbi:hypothetical protein AQUSIP_03510 [Aquicella siphonis]|uniref:Type II secretion system protein K n=1 Tax=Aquicella siphonis TaxID=254247 RepID=A0A5E4PEP0_9COXI|nr:type II secretion system minor pseudopilin GspK [Aquicella siphonis]VVC75075.1 hypothetical protein AQUSIP_03510 [Aquicella siphonis]